MYRSLHSLYWKRINGGKGLIGVKECVRIEKTSVGFYLKEQEQLLTEVLIGGVTPDMKIPMVLKRSYCNNAKKIMLREECTLHLWEVQKK